ncbi:hypothetical protein EKO04_003391 [Ascochyta lentis]|uniref:Uncharacterized protein n=1 Tax=Ascochyta lentis TaxID=205686 RepID=A0A8H7J5G1_9PLEO|nr:hypothetical protein EKO04_003391 [Ascochyta lentis]
MPSRGYTHNYRGPNYDPSIYDLETQGHTLQSQIEQLSSSNLAKDYKIHHLHNQLHTAKSKRRAKEQVYDCRWCQSIISGKNSELEDARVELKKLRRGVGEDYLVVEQMVRELEGVKGEVEKLKARFEEVVERERGVREACEEKVRGLEGRLERAEKREGMVRSLREAVEGLLAADDDDDDDDNKGVRSSVVGSV